MSEFWGVTCRTCDEFIKLGEQDKTIPTIYDPTNENMPIPHSCGSSYQYSTDDAVDENGASLNDLIPPSL